MYKHIVFFAKTLICISYKIAGCLDWRNHRLKKHSYPQCWRQIFYPKTMLNAPGRKPWCLFWLFRLLLVSKMENISNTFNLADKSLMKLFKMWKALSVSMFETEFLDLFWYSPWNYLRYLRCVGILLYGFFEIQKMAKKQKIEDFTKNSCPNQRIVLLGETSL